MTRKNILQKWDRKIVAEETSKFTELKLQAETEQRPHKVSFYVQKDKAQEIMKALSKRFEELEEWTWAFCHKVLEKGRALVCLHKIFKAKSILPKNTLVCGDSGNDAELFTIPDVQGVMSPTGNFVHPCGIEKSLHDCVSSLRTCYGDKQGKQFRVWTAGHGSLKFSTAASQRHGRLKSSTAAQSKPQSCFRRQRSCLERNHSISSKIPSAQLMLFPVATRWLGARLVAICQGEARQSWLTTTAVLSSKDVSVAEGLLDLDACAPNMVGGCRAKQ
ncbi:hypothetical protein RD792_005400 [Penstemon davidsonii]|uniref:Sucrose phosphatase-like domain-containing protein n=1 Tax=Penstemon davidsonii TaxID=160366 RepID=A0ABR0DK28_9LAMI|nr:hypothetical protein RD792_005400 [Penstemon davidsonii]